MLLHGLQHDLGDARRDVHARAAFDADRLEGDLAAAAADQDIGANTDADRGLRRRAAIGTRQGALGDTARREDQPDNLRILGEADVDAIAVDRAGIALADAVGASKQAVEVLRRAEDEALTLAGSAGYRQTTPCGRGLR